MIPGSACSVALQGMTGVQVEVEVAIGGGLPRVVLVGLPDSALYESRDRCRAAVAACQMPWPSQLLTINLTPATLRKAGSHYDLAIVAALFAAQDYVSRELASSTVLLGELGLDGRVRSVRGLIPMLLAARDAGWTRAVVPNAQVHEAELLEGITVWGIETLADLRSVLRGEPVSCTPPVRPVAEDDRPAGDLMDVLGQPEARWALEVAAAGRHHLALSGPPGVGKTMLASRLPGILPELTVEEALEVAAVHSLAGVDVVELSRRPPFSDPHHSATMASIVGGGARLAKPGAVSLAHRGVLFLDEAPEFAPKVLDALRTPLENGRIVLGRTDGQAAYPAAFQLVLASNPCPCGKFQTKQSDDCRCASAAIRRYAQRISGPILDRIDIHAWLNQVRIGRGAVVEPPETSAVVAARVLQARERQRERFRGCGFTTNADIPGRYLHHGLPQPDDRGLLDVAVEAGKLSVRGADKVLRLSWTLADLGERTIPNYDDVMLAMELRRGPDRVVAA